MSKIAEKLKEYNKSYEKYLAKVEGIKEQIKALEQQCVVLEQEDMLNKRKAFQEALAYIEKTAKDSTIKEFARRCVGFRSFQEIEAVISELDRYGIENLKVGGEMGLRQTTEKGEEHKSLYI